MMQYEVVDARASHLRYIAANMKKSDVDELMAIGELSPLSALSVSYRRADFAKVLLIDGKPEAIWGVGNISILTQTGAPWMLSSARAMENRGLVLNLSREWLKQLQSRYGVLRNFVDCRNRVTIRWLKWLGFSFSEPMIINGNPFLMFEMRR